MQTSFLERHAEDILGVYSCFDRIIIQGTLPDIAHADAMTQWFFTHQLRIFDFPAAKIGVKSQRRVAQRLK